MTALTSAKNTLRKQMKDVLQNISSQEKKEQSINVLKKVSQKETYGPILVLEFLKRLCSNKIYTQKSCI